MRSRSELKVESLVAAQTMSTLFLSVVSIGELEAVFTTMRDAARRARLEASLERHLVRLFPGHVLPVTQAIARRWGELDGIRQLAGRPLSVPDGMIAATALEHDLTVVTRNVKHFAGLGVTLLNPWLWRTAVLTRSATFLTARKRSHSCGFVSRPGTEGRPLLRSVDPPRAGPRKAAPS
jgi:predicted nucleic acid-binding protein